MKTASPVVILGHASSSTGSCGKVMDENTFPVGGRVWEKKKKVFVCSCTYSENRGIPFWSQNSYYIAPLRFCAIIISSTVWESMHEPVGNSVPYYDHS